MATKDINFRTKVTGTGAAKTKIQGVEKTAVTSAGKMGAAFAKMGAMLGVALGGAAILRLFSGAIDKFKVQELAVRKLDTALGYATKSLQDYAAGLQKVTTFGDENIINAMALIGMFVKEEDQIKKLTVATLDFAASKGVDLAMASDLIVKTFASSTNALSRYGLIVEGAAGSNERLNSLLQAMSVYGGQAEAMAKTLSGQMEQLSNKLGDQQEVIGEKLLPVWLELNKAFAFFADVLLTNLGTLDAGMDIMSGGTKHVQLYLDKQKELNEEIKKNSIPSWIEQGGQLSKTNELYEALGLNVPVVTKVLEEEAEVVGGLNKELTRTRELLKGVVGGAGIFQTGKRAGETGIGAGGAVSFSGGKGKDDNPIASATEAGLSEGFKKSEQMMRSVSMSWTNILSSNFSMFWDETFGYANSLLEQLLKATFMSIISSFLSFLPGGSILGAIFGGGGAGGATSASKGGTSDMIVLKIGDEEVSRFVNRGNEYNRMRRLN